MSEAVKHFTYSLGFASPRPRYAQLIDGVLAAVWAMIAFREYGSDWFLFGFALLMCGVRLGMGVTRDEM